MADPIRVTTPDGRVTDIPFQPGLTLAQAVFLSGRVEARPLCSGLGRCGQCRVRFENPAPDPLDVEILALGAEAVAQGWRLACRRPAEPGLRLALPPSRSPRPAPEATRIATPASPGRPLALAVDLGTTSLHWQALDAGRVAAQGQEINPQMGAGAEIMSRLAFATDPARADLLRTLVLDRLRAVAASLPGPVDRCCVAGNPAMIHLLLGLDAAGLRGAPYRLDYRGGQEARLAPDLPPAYIPPLPAPFVGADISAGLAHLLLNGPLPPLPLLLADLGTNGEFALVLSPRCILLASVPMGPALEGVGLSCGSLAEDGAATGFHLAPQGLTARVLGGRTEPSGVSGTGYLSLVRRLRAAGALDERGLFVSDQASLTPLARRILDSAVLAGSERRLPLPGGLHLTGADVEEILKVKAAFNLALTRLLAAAFLPAAGLASVRLAGAMGEHADPMDLEGLGFLPTGLAARISAAGNTSLAGARLLLERPDLRPRLADLCASCQVLDLASEPGFDRLYLDRMVFSYVP